MNKINSDDTERVNKFGAKLVNAFSMTLRRLLVKENHIFRLPIGVEGYLFVSVGIKKVGSYYPTKMRLKWVGSAKDYNVKHVPEYNVSFGSSSDEECVVIERYKKEGSVFLEYDDFMQYIKERLPYNRKIREVKPFEKPKPKPKKRKKKPKVYKKKRVWRLEWNEAEGRYKNHYYNVRVRRNNIIYDDE